MSEAKGETTAPQADTEAMLKALPEELRDTLVAFNANLIHAVFAQSTSMKGNEPIIRVTPDQVEFYKVRTQEVLESGVLNPHIYPPVEIKTK